MDETNEVKDIIGDAISDYVKKKLSKFLSYILRHNPQEIGLKLDEAGWINVDVLVSQCEEYERKAGGQEITREAIQEVVATNDKRRFEFSEDGERIRAVQGHSVRVELGYESKEPPKLLFHGTYEGAIESIRKKGLIKGERHHVHLSADRETAKNVGGRRGKPIVLMIRTAGMYRNGIKFFLAQNGVWLTESVSVKYLELPAGPTPYAVICDEHGQVFLDEEEYVRQLNRSNHLWVCTKCGEAAPWDDYNHEVALGIEPPDSV